MDWFVENMFKHVIETTGTYIEVGANDGTTQSYTYELEKLGWHGEPVIWLLESNREKILGDKNE